MLGGLTSSRPHGEDESYKNDPVRLLNLMIRRDTVPEA
jgi:hypothetical protein